MTLLHCGSNAPRCLRREQQTIQNATNLHSLVTPFQQLLKPSLRLPAIVVQDGNKTLGFQELYSSFCLQSVTCPHVYNQQQQRSVFQALGSNISVPHDNYIQWNSSVTGFQQDGAAHT